MLFVVTALQVEPREAVVPAGGELSVTVHVFLDDTVKFKDVLHALVTEGEDVNILLEATGGYCAYMRVPCVAGQH